MKKLLVIAVSIIAVLLVLSLGKDMIVKVSVEKAVDMVTGLKLSIGGFRVGIINTLVDISNLRLFNPPAFKDRVMLDMPKIYVDYELSSIFKGKVHLTDVRLNLREFMVVKNEKGELNLNSLKVVQAQKQGKKPQETTAGKAPEIQIDSLQLKIGKVIYKDYSKSSTPYIKEFDVNINEQYTNIKDPYALASLIVVRAMMNTTIAGLANFDLKGLQGTVSDTLSNAQKIFGDTAVKAQETVKNVTQVTDTAQSVVKDTASTMEKTGEALKDVFKNPFGSSQ